MTACDSNLWMRGVVFTNIGTTLFLTVFLLRRALADVRNDAKTLETLNIKRKVLQTGNPTTIAAREKVRNYANALDF